MTAPQRIPPLAAFEESPLRKLLVERLEATAVGDIVAYAELGLLVNCDVQNRCRHLLTSAQKVLMRRRIVFGTVINIGLKRLNDVGIVDRVAHGSHKIHRASKKLAKILTIAEYEKLSEEDQVRYRIEQLRLGAIVQFGQTGSNSLLLRAVHESVTPKQLKSALSKSLDQFE